VPSRLVSVVKEAFAGAPTRNNLRDFLPRKGLVGRLRLKFRPDVTMRAQLPASPDDIDFTVLAAAVKRGLGKLLLAVGVAGLVSVAIPSLIASQHASLLQIEITPLLAMSATLLLGLAFLVTRELFAVAERAPAMRSVARVQANLVASAIHSLSTQAGQSVTVVRTMPSVARRLTADTQGRIRFRAPAVDEAAAFDADARVADLARRLARHGYPQSCSARAPTVLGWDWEHDVSSRSTSTMRCRAAAPSRTSPPGSPPRKRSLPPPVRAWPASPPPRPRTAPCVTFSPQ
jgi:hypothetical protein